MEVGNGVLRVSARLNGHIPPSNGLFRPKFGQNCWRWAGDERILTLKIDLSGPNRRESGQQYLWKSEMVFYEYRAVEMAIFRPQMADLGPI